MDHAAGTRRDARVSLSLVVPVFNEAETVGLFVEKVAQVLGSDEQIDLQVIFVNDGSTDDTLERLMALQARDPRLLVIDLSRNFGKEAALTAGIDAACSDVVVPIDVDLQDPPELVLEMLAKWREGYEVVLARRINRDSDTWAKRVSASWFYRMHNRIASPKIPENAGDFRLMDRCVVEALKTMPESCRFMKGLFAWVGFRTAQVEYYRQPRVAGTSKFNGWKLWNFALEGFTSFSTDPLRVWTYIGMTVSLVSVLFAIFIGIKVLVAGVDVPGYASLMVAVSFLGGLQLMGIGVIGEYLGRTYVESKRRPVYFVRQVYEVKD
ncbi:glycosyltransferase family 2 protein [Stutzerimonas nitrititolerans]|uniref:glycosyltransferase family 2 protein n=1 Tax=Stutzerimonas nitrititolerans TaxID=2482751 RepID=UPI0028B0B16C|nr:glycosyltransferase family 2 protein [Stutzerimonas nitrititolerans]